MPPPATRSNRLELGLHLVVFALAAVVLTFLSHGAYNDDDLDHYFMAAASLRDPRFLVDYWGRAGFTTLYALPAQFGWTATRLFTLLLVLLTGFITARTAAGLGARHPAVWGALSIWQPLVLLLSFSVLTEPFAALLIAIVLNRQAGDRPLGAALAAGLLPTVRLELGIVSCLVAGWIVWRHRRSWYLLPLMALPLLLWAVLGAAVHGAPLWLLNEIRAAERPLVTAGPVHYLRNLIVVTGPVVFLGLGLGAWNLATRGVIRPLFAAITWIVVFSLFAGLDRWDRVRAEYTTMAAIADAKPGSIIVWENHYSWRLYGDIWLPQLRNDPAWRLIREFEADDRRFRVVIFERVGP